MSGVKIFLVVMACSGDLLTCDDISRPQTYLDMDACQAARQRTLGDDALRDGMRPQVLARCRYGLGDDTRVARIPEPPRAPEEALLW